MKVFDASAVLALIFAETGAHRAEQLIDEGHAVISSVNHAEVVARLLDRGMRSSEVKQVCEALRLQVMPFTAQQAVASGYLRPITKPLGLSLGDRCCLALALEQPGATVVTADHAWQGLESFDVQLIR